MTELTSAAVAAVAAGVVATVSFGATASRADTCAENAITARGEASSFEWLAKTKARANWRSRVRATRALGPPYSSPSRAQDALDTCAPTASGAIVCAYTATPCRP